MANAKQGQPPKGRARCPANPERPESPAVKKALSSLDMDALRKALTYKQRRFCEEYIVDFNGSAAAIRAGYSTKYPDRIAFQLLNNKGVETYCDFLTASAASKIMSINPDYVVQGIMKIVGKETGKDGDKLRGYELLARILGMFVDRTELTGKDGGAIEVEQRKIDEETQALTNMLNSMRKRTSEKDQHGLQ